MDFKQYVKAILEAENIKDKNKKAKDEDFDDEDEDDDDDEDDEDEASCKTHKEGCTGCEASVYDDDDLDEDFYDDYDLDEDFYDDYDLDEDFYDDYEIPVNPLRESMIYSSKYIGTNNDNCLTEDVYLLCEGIRNNSASKFLSKLSKKSEKEAAKWERKGDSDKVKSSKEAAKKLKEASSELLKAETNYKEGNPEAKMEYKRLCKKYSKELKKMGRGAKIAAIVTSLVAGSALLGAIGLTGLANDDVINQLEDGIKDGNLGDVIKGIAIKDKEALADLADSFKEGGLDSAIDKAKNLKTKEEEPQIDDFTKALHDYGKIGDKARETYGKNLAPELDRYGRLAKEAADKEADEVRRGIRGKNVKPGDYTRGKNKNPSDGFDKEYGFGRR